MSTEINPVVNIEEVEEQKTPSAPNRLKRVKLIVAYDGTNYHGWQVQKTEISVAQTLERPGRMQAYILWGMLQYLIQRAAFRRKRFLMP